MVNVTLFFDRRWFMAAIDELQRRLLLTLRRQEATVAATKAQLAELEALARGSGSAGPRK